MGKYVWCKVLNYVCLLRYMHEYNQTVAPRDKKPPPFKNIGHIYKKKATLVAVIQTLEGTCGF